MTVAPYGSLSVTGADLAVPVGPPRGHTVAADLCLLPDAADRWHLLVGRWLLGYQQPLTRRAYATDLGQWRAFVLGLGVEDPVLAGRDHVAAWQHVLDSQGRSRSTVARKTACLAAFYAYLVDEDVIARTPVRGRRPRPSEETTSTGLTEREAARLLDTAVADGVRSAVLIGMLYLLGLRVSEALGARVEDLGWERGHRTLKITRKGGRTGRVPLPVELVRLVDVLIGDRTSGTVICTRTGKPVDSKAAWETVRRLGRKAGLPQAATLHPHDLRHGHATAAMDAGVPLKDVQDSLGHADPRTTRRYDRSRGRIDRHPGSVLAGRLAPYRAGDDNTDVELAPEQPQPA
jgi:integrase/recombinase XerD